MAGSFIVGSFLAPQLPAQPVTLQPWTWKNPIPQGNTLSGVSVLPDGTIIAVGDGGMLMRSTDQGATWTTNPNPAGLRRLYAVHFINQTVGFVTGDDGEGIGNICRTTDGGFAWSLLPTTTFAVLTDINFYDEDNGMAVGTGGTALVTNNGGDSWVSTYVGAPASLSSVVMTSEVRAVAGAPRGVAFGTANDGGDWFSESALDTLDIASMSLGSGLTLAVGQNGFIASRDNFESNWILRTAPAGTPSLHAVHWTSAKQVVAVGSQGAVVRSTNFGVAWESSISGTSRDLKAVHSADTTLVVAAGSYGTMVRSTDGGASWSLLSDGPTISLNDVSTSRAGTGIAVGSGGTILYRPTSTSPWEVRSVGVSLTLPGCLMISDSVGLIVANNRIWRSADAGMSWDSIPLPSTTNLRRLTHRGKVTLAVGTGGIILRSTDSGLNWGVSESGVSTSLRTVSFATDSVVVCFGTQGTIIRSTDAGQSWNPIAQTFASGTLSEVAFSDSLNGFVVGAARDVGIAASLAQTTDGGLTWDDRTISFAAELGAAFVSFNSVAVSRSGVWTIAGSHGLFYRSANNGQSWSRIVNGTSKNTNRVVLDGDRWIAVGTDGMIIESPADPTLSVSVESPAHPSSPLLLQAFPNPFNPTTSVVISSDRNTLAQVEVFDLLGRRLFLVFEGRLRAREKRQLLVDGGNLRSGSYFVRFSTSDGSFRALPLLLLK